MNREEILTKSRNDNKDGDEREKKIRLDSVVVGSVVAVVLCVVLSFVEEFVFDRSSTVIWVIVYGVLFSEYLVQAIKLRGKNYILLAVAFGIGFFGKLAVYVIENLR